MKTSVLISVVAVVCFFLGTTFQTFFRPSIVIHSGVAEPKIAKRYKNEEMNDLIREHSNEIQECYLEFLKGKEDVEEGALELIIHVAENGDLNTISVRPGKFGDDKLKSCVVSILRPLAIAPPPLGINRYLSHSLNFLDEKTAKKRAEKRAKENRPPLVLPANPEQ